MGEISAFDDPLPGQLRIDASGTPSPAPAATEREVAAALSDSKDTDRD